jgi:hypothetical protein
VTVESTTAAVARIPRHRLWGIGSYAGGDGVVDLPVGWDELERDAAWAEGMLAGYDLGQGSYVVVVSDSTLSPWHRPIELALRSFRAVQMPTGIQRYDAFRTAMFLRRVDVTMVVGPTLEVAEALAEQPGGLRALFGDVPFILAEPPITHLLRAAGLHPFTIVRLGPALGLECRERGGVHVNAREWAVSASSGELELSTIAARAHVVERARLGLRGTVVTESCLCGRDDPRIVIDG